MFEDLEAKLTNAPSSGRHAVSPGVYLATVFGIVEIGNVVGTKYKSDEVEEVDTIKVLLEFPTEVDAEGVPATTTVKLPVKFGDLSHLTKFKNATVDKDGTPAASIASLVGRSLQVEVVSSQDKSFTFVDKKSFSKPMKGMSIPETYNSPVLFGMTAQKDGATKADFEVFKGLTFHTMKEIMATSKGAGLGLEFHDCFAVKEEEDRERRAKYKEKDSVTTKVKEDKGSSLLS